MERKPNRYEGNQAALRPLSLPGMCLPINPEGHDLGILAYRKDPIGGWSFSLTHNICFLFFKVSPAPTGLSRWVLHCPSAPPSILFFLPFYPSFIHPSDYPSAWVFSIHLSIDPPTDPTFYLSIHPSIHPFVHPSVYPSLLLSIYPSIFFSVHPSLYPSTPSFLLLSIHLSLTPSLHPFEPSSLLL